MKKFYILLFMLLMLKLSISAQMNILFVNDNGINAQNTETILNTLNLSGFTYDVFDAIDLNRSPELSELTPYDFVIWYMSSDGVGRFFWNGNDTDNESLKFYLLQGGNLWVIGTDFMYDRYSAPTLFESGSFIYDYLGAAEYHAQSYANDGSQGVPQLDLVNDITWLTVNPIQWIFTTLWYVDAMVPSPSAQAVYMMGPQSYVLSQYAAALYLNNELFKVLSFYFDPALIDTEANRVQLFTEVRIHFENLVDIKEEISGRSGFTVHPNPANDLLIINRASSAEIFEKVSIFDVMGKEVLSIDLNLGLQGQINVSNLNDGIYFIRHKNESKKVIVSRQ